MKKIIQTDNAPAAIGPYSQGVISGNFLFVSGQLAIDPSSGKLISGSITLQTERIMNNLAAISEAAGTDLSKIVKTTIFLIDLNDFAEVNKTYANFFQKEPPARSTVQVAGLPLNAEIEIEAIISIS